MVGILMYVWIQEPLATKIVMIVVSVFSLSPFLHYVIP